MHHLAACLIFKDSATYLDEWLRFHLRVGFDHFYLYDNDSTDNYRSVIRPFVAAGQITLHRWPGVRQQMQVYQHCLDQYRTNARWITFTDDDEFLFPAVADSVPLALEPYECHAGVAACWLLFGSNGHKKRPNGLVIHNYTRRAPWVDRHVKCIVDPQKVTAPAIAAHAFHCRPGETVVDENFRPMNGPFAEQPSASVFCLNHYLIKSHEEMLRRRTTRQVTGEAESVHSIAKWQEFDSAYNAVEDLRIQRFATGLQQKPWWRRIVGP